MILLRPGVIYESGKGSLVEIREDWGVELLKKKEVVIAQKKVRGNPFI